MNRSDFISKLETAIDAPAGSLAETQLLSEILEWDSLAVVSFMALADSTCGKKVAPAAISACKTVADLINLLD
jgi:acyl carrier protein